MTGIVKQLENMVMVAKKAAAGEPKNSPKVIESVLIGVLLTEMKRAGYGKTGYMEINDTKAIQVFCDFEASLRQSLKEARPGQREQLEVELAWITNFAKANMPAEMSEALDYEGIIGTLIAENPEKAAAVKINPNNIGWFTGQVMKATNGRGNPKEVIPLLKAALEA